jgi:hypothetical protein
LPDDDDDDGGHAFTTSSGASLPPWGGDAVAATLEADGTAPMRVRTDTMAARAAEENKC